MVLSPCGGTLLHPTCTYGTCSYSSMMLAIRHRNLHSVLPPCDGTLLHLTCICGTYSYLSVILHFIIEVSVYLRNPSASDLWDPTAFNPFYTYGTLLHPTCTCGTCSYSSVMLAFHHRSLCVPAGPFSISDLWDPSVYMWDRRPSPSDLWDPKACMSHVPMGPSDLWDPTAHVSHVLVGPFVPPGSNKFKKYRHCLGIEPGTHRKQCTVFSVALHAWLC
jgi:hypothetical protein